MSRANEPAYPILNMSDPDFAEQLMAALGVKPGDKIEFITPQFNRTDGVRPAIPDSWAMLTKLPKDTLKAIGCCAWNEPDDKGNMLMLFPHEWYAHIPDGFMVTDIFGKTEPFECGKTDDDRRFGCLAYGVTIKADATLSAMEAEHGKVS